MRSELAAGKLSFFLCGEKLKGSFALVRTDAGSQWLLIKHRTALLQPNDVLARQLSVLSGVSLRISQRTAAPPRLPAAQLVPHGAGGNAAAQARADAGGDGRDSRAPSRSGAMSPSSTAIASSLTSSRRRAAAVASRPGSDRRSSRKSSRSCSAQPVDQMILDGEIVALEPRPAGLIQRAAESRPAQERRRDRPRPARSRRWCCVCFDLLHFAGINLRGAPYLRRRRYLSQCLLPGAAPAVGARCGRCRGAVRGRARQRLRGHRRQAYRQPLPAGSSARARGCKFKAVRSAEFVIGGYTARQGRARAPGRVAARLLERQAAALRRSRGLGAGRCHDCRELLKRCRSSQRNDSPFAEKPPLHRPTTWLEPELVAEVSFTRVDSRRAALRAPVFVRLRDDVAPGSVAESSAQARDAPAHREPARRTAEAAATATAESGRNPAATR